MILRKHDLQRSRATHGMGWRPPHSLSLPTPIDTSCAPLQPHGRRGPSFSYSHLAHAHQVYRPQRICATHSGRSPRIARVSLPVPADVFLPALRLSVRSPPAFPSGYSPVHPFNRALQAPTYPPACNQSPILCARRIRVPPSDTPPSCHSFAPPEPIILYSFLAASMRVRCAAVCSSGSHMSANERVNMTLRGKAGLDWPQE